MFKFVDRQKDKDLAIIPGWAFDYRIFDALDLPYNYFFYNHESVANFEGAFKNLLEEKGIKKMSVMGWSQGAFAAYDFACKNPGVLDEIILIGLRKKYKKRTLEKIRKYITKYRTTFLQKFYEDCFYRKEKPNYNWFKNTLLESYLKEMTTEKLSVDLEWLSKEEFRPEALKDIESVTIVHGKKDAVALVSEVREISGKLPHAKFVCFEQTGHLPFLREDFTRRLYDD